MNANSINAIVVRPKESTIGRSILNTDIQTNNSVIKSTDVLTKLDVLFWSKHQIAIIISLSSLLTGMIMIISILIVFLTSPKPTQKKCELDFKLMTEKPIEYQYGPHFVAIADFNNDAILDLVIAQQTVHKITIYFGNGNGNFKNSIEYSIGLQSSPCMVQVDDFNNDSQLDIAVANFGSNSIVIFYGFKNGSFTESIRFSTNSSQPIAIITADFDNDLLPDIATANYGTHSVSIYYGYTKFQSSVTYSTDYDSYPIALTATDFNNDNYTDLAISNYGTNNIHILFGNSNKTFDRRIIISTGLNSQPCSLATEYFNADNYIDLVTTNYGSHEVKIFLNNGNGTFTNHISYSTGSASPYTVGVGDFNQDHRFDIVVTNKGSNYIALYLGNGNGSFKDARKFPTGSNSSISVGIGDFNRDHRLDMAVVNDDTGNFEIFLGSYEGFSNQTTYIDSSSLSSIAVADFNNDAHLDIVIANYDIDEVIILLGFGDGSFTNETIGISENFLLSYFLCICHPLLLLDEKNYINYHLKKNFLR